MFLVGIFSWWYGQGWLGQLGRVRGRLTTTAQFFSIGQLASTLFSPFRQISAGAVQGPIGVVFRAMIDKLISRVIGAIVRLFTIIAGLVTLAVQLVYELVILVIWLVIPLLPVVGLILMSIGWIPRWM